MNATPIFCAVAGLPLGWLSGVLIDRVPGQVPLRPLPGIRMDGFHGVVQVAMVALLGGIGWRFRAAPPLVVVGFVLLGAMLITVSVIDVQVYRLPDRIVLPTLGASVAIVLVEAIRRSEPSQVKYAAVGALMYFGFLFVVHLISPAGMGFGDVKLAVVMGLYLGWLAPSYEGALALVLWGMLVGFVVGSVVGLAMLVGRRRSTPIPFGPFLALGVLAVVFAGQNLVSARLVV